MLPQHACSIRKFPGLFLVSHPGSAFAITVVYTACLASTVTTDNSKAMSERHPPIEVPPLSGMHVAAGAKY
jgi:hypothetical protein